MSEYAEILKRAHQTVEDITNGIAIGQGVHVGYGYYLVGDEKLRFNGNLMPAMVGKLKIGHPKCCHMAVTVAPGVGMEAIVVSTRVVMYKKKRPVRPVIAMLDVGTRVVGTTPNVADVIMDACVVLRDLIADIVRRQGRGEQPKEPETLDVGMYMAAEEIK